jgi:hypothetical protein
LRLAGITTIALLSCYLARPAYGQDRYAGWCASLEHADSSDLVEFLNGVVPEEKNAHCVTWALHRLGDERYEPAIHALVRLVDFRRPLTEMEKGGAFLRPSVIGEMFPTAESLEQIGRSAQPEILQVIASDSASATARENAISVWMEFYKFERPKGVALLKQEERKATTEAARQKFSTAARTAVKYCLGDPDEPACESAAKTGRF